MVFEITAGEIALNIGLGIISGVGGNAATSGLNQALSYIGLGGVFGSDSGPDYTAWFQQIAAQLATLQTMIEEANQSLQQVQQQLVEITQEIEESELQDILLQYSSNTNTINTYFEQYVTFLSAMANEQEREEAVKDMYNLLSSDAPDQVATAMSNIANYMMGTGELKSIISYQTNVCLQAITNWASNPGNFTMGSYSVGELSFHGYPARFTSVEIADSSQLITQSFSAAVPPIIEQDVLPTFKAGLTIQAKGLLFLVAAWKKTLLEPNLTTYNQNINAQIQMMSQFYGNLVTAAANHIRDNIVRQYMVRLGSTANAYVSDVNRVDPPYTEWVTWSVTNITAVPPINPDEWLSRIGHEQVGNMVQIHSGAINPNFSFGQQVEALQIYHFTYNTSSTLAVATVPDPAGYISQTPPQALQSFLQSLPTATSESSQSAS
jgi:hypothetical protein